jgi:hypothetical protein
MKIACVIQGDIRRGSSLVLQEMPKHFDCTILSTWGDEKAIPKGNFSVIQSVKPPAPGFTSRNFQRKSTAKGIERARAEGCTHVLKWRTDMLPTTLDVKQLLAWSNHQVPAGAKSRLVMPAFRTISIEPDYLSSIPDLFAFGHIDDMEILWNDDGFDYTQQYNIPPEFKNSLLNLVSGNDLQDFYCAESELYANYQSRLRHHLGTGLTHKEIAEQRLRLIDYRELGILWFGPKTGFRSVGQAWEHFWWTEKNWLKQNAQIHPYGRPIGGIRGRIRRKISKMKVQAELKEQEKIWQQQYPAVQL